MSEPEGSNLHQPGDGSHVYEDGNPPGTIVRLVRRLGLHHPHAPHWIIALFTFVLAVFAFFAWVESTRTTVALQGQLDVLKAQQRPFLYYADAVGGPVTGLPNFSKETGQIVWNFVYLNFGHSVAYRVSPEMYIRVGEDKFQPSLPPINKPSHIDLPPGSPKWATAFSRKGFNEDYFNSLMKQDGGIQIRVEFHYSDASLQAHYTNGFCLQHFANGSVGILAVDECQ
jgi:hypothetical protein